MARDKQFKIMANVEIRRKTFAEWMKLYIDINEHCALITRIYGGDYNRNLKGLIKSNIGLP